MRLPREMLSRFRAGEPWADEEIAGFVAGIADGTVSDAQAAAFAMAVCLRGLPFSARVALTRAMADSGTRLDWRSLNLPGPVLDKHSAGGVGDKVTLILVPLVAACGGYMPKLSGAGLGHTGGTLDKIKAIPGYQAHPDLAVLRRVVAECGCVVAGAGADLAPADKRLYAIRDVTGTVESIDLITASIISKKLAAGAGALVLDVTVGSGALVATPAEGTELARSLVSAASGAGLPTVAVLTSMNQVRGRTAGNALEVREAIDALTGGPFDPGLRAVVFELGIELLMLSGLAAGPADAERRLQQALAGGRAAERFARMVASLGGPADLLEAPGRSLASAPVQRPVWPVQAGRVAAIDVRRLGLLVVGLGGGRRHSGDAINPAVGLAEVATPGDQVGPGGQPLAVVHAADEAAADWAASELRGAIAVAGIGGEPGPVVIGRIGDG